MMELINRQVTDKRLSHGEILSQMVGTREVSLRDGIGKARGTRVNLVNGTWNQISGGGKLLQPTGEGKSRHTQHEDMGAQSTAAQTSSEFGKL